MADHVDLIGLPFAYGGRGPDQYDCYGLLRELYRRDGLDIPDYASPTDGPRILTLMESQLHLWAEVETSEPGCTVYMIVRGHAHVGYCVGGGKFVHTWEKSGGVTVERLSMWKNRIVGFYRYAGK